MKNQIILGVAALALGFVAVSTLNPVFAYLGDSSNRGPNYSVERHETNQTAFEKGDYKAWVANMNGRGATRFVNEANFKEFAAAQLATQKGDSTLIIAFRAKYNWTQGNGRGNGGGCGMNR